MPPGVVSLCRDAWRPITDQPRAVVHGDPGAANIRITPSEVGLIDWDVARVDATVLDLTALPLDATDLNIKASGLPHAYEGMYNVIEVSE